MYNMFLRGRFSCGLFGDFAKANIGNEFSITFRSLFRCLETLKQIENLNTRTEKTMFLFPFKLNGI